MNDPAFLVLSTFPTADAARQIARRLVEEHLVACANILPGVESIYVWKGNVETAGETLVLFKTTQENYPRVERRIRELHPYEVPEIVALEFAAVQPDYLKWLRESCGIAADNAAT